MFLLSFFPCRCPSFRVSFYPTRPITCVFSLIMWARERPKVFLHDPDRVGWIVPLESVPDEDHQWNSCACSAGHQGCQCNCFLFLFCFFFCLRPFFWFCFLLLALCCFGWWWSGRSCCRCSASCIPSSISGAVHLLLSAPVPTASSDALWELSTHRFSVRSRPLSSHCPANGRCFPRLRLKVDSIRMETEVVNRW